MANNEISGPVVLSFLASLLRKQKNYYSYRFVFLPETIGSIAYISKNIEHLKRSVVAGFNATCIGDERNYSMISGRDKNSLSERVARVVLENTDPNFVEYDWSFRASDERQYCAPGVDLPVTTVMRTKFASYPEYHTSDDKLGTVVTQNGLSGGLRVLQRCCHLLENNYFFRALVKCEPMMGERTLQKRKHRTHLQ